MSSSTVTRQELSNRFSSIDYVVFTIMLLLSAAIGVFYGCFKKMKNTNDFLMAGRSMGTFPVAMSLIASFMSAITLLGTPSEVYKNGFSYWMIGLSYFLVMPAAAYLILPVFWKLQVTSAYEYLEVRFSKPVRMLGSLVFLIQMSMYMAIVVFAPALALSQVTGINVYVSVSVICFVCIFYTTLGGMKAVLWTDALQVAIMYFTMVFIIIYGAMAEGGFKRVWEVATRGNRTSFDNYWNPDPTQRHTVWTCIFGGYFTWITIYGFNQAQVQRYMCVRKMYMAVNALWINMVGLFILMITCAFGGLVIYAKYETCDPQSVNLVTSADQLLPFYVMDTLGTYKGLPGLFVAGIFAGALSTVSSGMNSLAAITLEDFIKGGCFPNMSDKTATTTSKVLSLFYGLLTFALVFVAEKLGDVLSAALSIFGMVGGPLCGVFTLGMFVPWANATGAFVGTIVSLVVSFWIGGGYQVLVHTKVIIPPSIPVNTYGCSANLTITTPPPLIETVEQSGLISLYRVSYLYYSAIAVIVALVVGIVVSLITGKTDIRTINPDSVSPLIHWISRLISGISIIGIDYDGAQDKVIKQNQSEASLNGAMNLAFSESMPPVKNGHIEHEGRIIKIIKSYILTCFHKSLMDLSAIY